jgi:hypothetical protein
MLFKATKEKTVSKSEFLEVECNNCHERTNSDELAKINGAPLYINLDHGGFGSRVIKFDGHAPIGLRLEFCSGACALEFLETRQDKLFWVKKENAHHDQCFICEKSADAYIAVHGPEGSAFSCGLVMTFCVCSWACLKEGLETEGRNGDKWYVNV